LGNVFSLVAGPHLCHLNEPFSPNAAAPAYF
jgi:hypothetical protein